MDRHFGGFGKRNLVRTVQGSGNGRPAFLPWLRCAVDPTQIPLSPAGQRPGGQGLWSRTTRCASPAQPWKPQGNKKPLFPHDRLCTERVPAAAQPRGRTCRWTWRESPRRGTEGARFWFSGWTGGRGLCPTNFCSTSEFTGPSRPPFLSFLRCSVPCLVFGEGALAHVSPTNSGSGTWFGGDLHSCRFCGIVVFSSQSLFFFFFFRL